MSNGSLTRRHEHRNPGPADLISCPVIKKYEEILSMPANQAIKNLKYKVSELKKAAETLRKKLEAAQESNERLKEEPDELRAQLKGFMSFAEKQSTKLSNIKQWFADNKHPLAPNETIIQKLDNMEAIIRSRGQQIEELKEKQNKKSKKKAKPKKSNSLGVIEKLGGL